MTLFLWSPRCTHHLYTPHPNFFPFLLLKDCWFSFSILRPVWYDNVQPPLILAWWPPAWGDLVLYLRANNTHACLLCSWFPYRLCTFMVLRSVFQEKERRQVDRTKWQNALLWICRCNGSWKFQSRDFWIRFDMSTYCWSRIADSDLLLREWRTFLLCIPIMKASPFAEHGARA